MRKKIKRILLQLKKDLKAFDKDEVVEPYLNVILEIIEKESKCTCGCDKCTSTARVVQA